MYKQFERLPQTLQPKVEAHAAAIEKKVENICRRNRVSQDAAAAIVADACDMLAGEFHGMNATYEQMREVATKTKRSSWERTEMNALCMVAEYYNRIVENTEQGRTLAGTILDAPIEYELERQAGRQPKEEDEKRCMFLYFTLCVLIVGECCDATEEELRGIGGEDIILYEPQRSHSIASALQFQQQRKQYEETRRKRAKARGTGTDGTHTEGVAGVADVAEAVAVAEYIQERPKRPVNNPDRTTKYYQNVTNVLAGELLLAPYSKEDAAKPLRPLKTAIAERIAAAEALKAQAKTDDHITLEMVQNAENLITNADSIYKAIDGLHIMLCELQPTGKTDTATEYTTTPFRFTQLATGQQNPNQRQIVDTMRALDFLSRERMEVVEKVVKYYRTKDADGNVVKKPQIKTFYTRFSPATTTFYGEFGDEAQNSTKAFSIKIAVHRMVTDGRSAERVALQWDNGKKMNLPVLTPRENFMSIEQVYNFNSEAGSRFRNTLISKVRMEQDKLLADVFDYAGKARDAQAKLKDSPEWKEWERVKDDTNATDEQKAAAKKKVEPLLKNATAKRIASKHSDRDIQTLCRMFEEAQRCGLIRSYHSKPAAGAKQKANGEYTAVVWEWLRPKKEDVLN